MIKHECENYGHCEGVIPKGNSPKFCENIDVIGARFEWISQNTNKWGKTFTNNHAYTMIGCASCIRKEKERYAQRKNQKVTPLQIESYEDDGSWGTAFLVEAKPD